MLIGKTSSSISKSEIFEKYSEVQVVCTVFNLSSIPCKISSPFRVDSNPSFSIYLNDQNHVCFKDFGNNERGSLLDLLCKYWNCSFNQVFDRILQTMQSSSAEGISPLFTPRHIKVLTRKEASAFTKIQVAVRPWRQEDYDYWASYGVEKQWLKYAEIYPISHKIITKKVPAEDGSVSEKRYIFPADRLAYAFIERKEGKLQIKVYQPFNTKGFKWCSSMDGSVIGLWTKIPQTGDRVVLCSSIKDALCLSCQCHIPALCLQGEGYSISNTAQEELRRRYKKVFICFDTDKPGREDAEKLAKETGFVNIVPDLGSQKDLSDYFKSLEDKTKFKELESLFH